MSIKSKTFEILKKYNIRAKKRLGQNFLINEQVLDRIVEESDITPNDLVIEIGPGLGVLTHKLCQNAGHVLAIEIDEKMVEILNETLGNYQNVSIINEDILKINIEELISKNKLSGSVKVVANLPYYITTPILMRLLEETKGINKIVIMVQKEVGERFVASPKSKDYGAITLNINYYASSKIILEVPKESFLPSPEVTSCVVSLDIREKPPIDINKEDFTRLVKASFAQRRKTFVNSVSNSGAFNISKEELISTLTSLGINESCRAEDLSIYDYEKIVKAIKDV